MGVSAVASGQMEAFWSPRTYLLMETMLAGHPAVEMAFGTSTRRECDLGEANGACVDDNGNFAGYPGDTGCSAGTGPSLCTRDCQIFGMAPDLQIELDTYRVTTREKQCSRSQRPL